MQATTLERNVALGPELAGAFLAAFPSLAGILTLLLGSAKSKVLESSTLGFNWSASILGYDGVAVLAIFLGGALSRDGVLILEEILLIDFGESCTEERVLAMAILTILTNNLKIDENNFCYGMD